MDDVLKIKSFEEAKLKANEYLLASKAFVMITLDDNDGIDYVWSTSQLKGFGGLGFIVQAISSMKEIKNEMLKNNNA